MGRGRKRWRNQRCGGKGGMRWIETIKEEEWKGKKRKAVGAAGGGADGSMCSDTALCVAMVQAQSELHSSFAAQLANYPQTAMLIRRRPKPSGFPRAFFDCRTDTRARLREQFIYLYVEKCIWRWRHRLKMQSRKCAVGMWWTALLNAVVVLCCVSRATCVI